MIKNINISIDELENENKIYGDFIIFWFSIQNLSKSFILFLKTFVIYWWFSFWK